MARCPSCGEKSAGFFKQCGRCEQASTIGLNLKSKIPFRPIDEPEDDED